MLESSTFLLNQLFLVQRKKLKLFSDIMNILFFSCWWYILLFKLKISIFVESAPVESLQVWYFFSDFFCQEVLWDSLQTVLDYSTFSACFYKSEVYLHQILTHAIYIVVIFVQFSGQLPLCTEQCIPNNLNDNLYFSVRKSMTRQFNHCAINLISNSFFWFASVELLRQDRWLVNIMQASCLRSRYSVRFTYWCLGNIFHFFIFLLLSSSTISDSAAELYNCSDSWLLSGSLNCMCSVLILETEKKSLFCSFSYFSLCFFLPASAMWYLFVYFPSHDAFRSVLIDTENL